MKKVILLFIILHSHLAAYNQTVKGTVFDSRTHEPVSSASVFFNGTYVGTLTDETGNFDLEIGKITQMPLTISALGYYSASLNNLEYKTNKPVLVYLTPKLFEINEIVVDAKSLARERKYNLSIFKDEFLGTSVNAQYCEITNENDITFNYESDRDTLRVYAAKPLLIVNNRLGFKITYYLDNFEFIKKTKSCTYNGNIIFNEDLVTEESLKPVFERRRKITYMGSRMHFFRTVWTNNYKSAGYGVKNRSDEYLDFKNFVIEDDSLNKFLKYGDDLFIYYYSKFPVGNVKFQMDKVYFDSTGYYDSQGIAWGNQMADKRIGDQLPFEYISNEHIKVKKW